MSRSERTGWVGILLCLYAIGIFFLTADELATSIFSERTSSFEGIAAPITIASAIWIVGFRATEGRPSKVLGWILLVGHVLLVLAIFYIVLFH